MSLDFGKAILQGPFSQLEELDDAAGVVVVLCLRDKKFNLLEVFISNSIRMDVARSLRSATWKKFCQGKLRIGVFYTTDKEEQQTVKESTLWCKSITEKTD